MLNQQIGSYKIISKLGEGGMANVYLAEKGTLSKKVALKVLKDEFLLNQHIRNRFLSEAKKMSGLNHANIVGVHDLIDEKDFVAIELDYVEGKTLKQHLHEKGALPDEEIESLFKQMLDALAYIHEKEFVHRDVKPSNFMLTENGIIKLTDFGIAKNVDDSNMDYTGTGTGMQMGTPKYMSPEQVRSTKDVDHRTDIYSLGVVLWEMVTGKVPYDIQTSSTFDVFTKIVNEPLEKTNTRWDEVIQKATKKEVGERYFHVCDVFLKDKIKETKKPAIKTEPPTKPPSVKGPIKLNKYLIIIASILVVVFVAYHAHQKDLAFKENLEFDKQKEYIRNIKTFEDAKSFSEGLAAVKGSYKENYKWGYIDKKGNSLTFFRYKSVWPFSEGLAAVKEYDKWGYVDKKGRKVIPLKYGNAFPFSEGLAAVSKNGKWGFINKTGDEVIPFIHYDEYHARQFSEGLVAVEKNRKWGFMDKKGNLIVPYIYDFARDFSGGLAVFEVNDKWGYVDKDGKEVIQNRYDMAWSFSEGLAAVEMNGKWGYINEDGKEVIPIQYEDAKQFSEGLAPVRLVINKWFKNDMKWQYIDKNGNEVFSGIYDGAESFSEGLAAVQIDGSWGYINKYGYEVIQNKYFNVEPFSEGVAKVNLVMYHFFIDKKGNAIGLK